MSPTDSSTVAGPATIAEVPAVMTAAWAGNDSSAIADLFTEDASFVLPGVFLKNREEIRAYMTAGYAGQYNDTTVVGTPLGVRLINDTTAVLVSEGGVVQPGETEPSGERFIRGTWVLVKLGGVWKIYAYHNSQVNN